MMAVPAWAIIPAKEALKETQVAEKVVKKINNKKYKECIKENQNNISASVDDHIKRGVCSIDISMDFYICKINDYPTSIEEDKEKVFIIFKDMGYSANLKNDSGVTVHLSWCSGDIK